MFVQQVFAIHDSKLGAFLRPFFAPSVGAATRSFVDELGRADGEMHKHGEDYDLYHLGTWNDESAQFVNFSMPVLLLAGVHCGLKGGRDVS